MKDPLEKDNSKSTTLATPWETKRKQFRERPLRSEIGVLNRTEESDQRKLRLLETLKHTEDSKESLHGKNVDVERKSGPIVNKRRLANSEISWECVLSWKNG